MKTTLKVFEFLKTQTREVVLFFSGGKDSIVLLDLLTKNGFKVNIAFMYFVKDLEHIEKYVTWAEKKYKVKANKYPHWMLSHSMNDNLYRFHTAEKIPNIKLSDIEKQAQNDFNCKWIINGAKKSDSMNRNLMLKTYFLQAINLTTKHAYPISGWKNQMCLSYIKQNKLPIPISYNKSKSSGAGLNKDFLQFCKDKYPNDYAKVLDQFPFAETLLM